MTTIRSRSAAETEAIAADLARGLAPGDLVLVSGELGTGKTTFVRGACRALGVTEPVVSPTFTIGRRYAGSVPVSHLDLYRLDALDAEEPGFLEDYVTPDAIAFIEWPAVAEPELSGVAARVTIEHAGGDEREVTVARAAAGSSRD